MKSEQDIYHLRLLSTFHYVLAGMLALFFLFPIIHLAIGVAIVSGAFDDFDGGGPPPKIMGWMFIILPSAIMLCGFTVASLVALSGRRLARHTRYTFCLVVAAIECLFMPIGTALGVFTIIVLVRPSVKALFGVRT